MENSSQSSENPLEFTNASEMSSFEGWRRKVSDEFVKLTLEPENVGVFRGSLRAIEFGDLLMANLWHDPLKVSRSAGQAQGDVEHFYKITVQLDGYSIIAQDDRESALAPGDFTIYTTERPFTVTTPASARSLVIAVPIETMRMPGRLMDQITAVRVSGRTGLGVVASKFMTGLDEGLGKRAILPSRELADSVLSVLRSTLTHEFGESLAAGDESTGATILAYIEQRLGDPEFSQDEVASAHHISVRQLQRIFQEQGTTFSQWVQSRRLEQIRRELERAGQPGAGVHDIAITWGIHDASYFSRLFKQRYGMTPTEYRFEHTVSERPPKKPPAH